MFYKNVASFAKTFFGITFNPGETKEVDKFINDKFMIVVDAPQPPAKPSAPKKEEKKSEKPAKDEDKSRKDTDKIESPENVSK